ncbi:MAG: hypothetical protein JWM07_249 [Candidatus Saccharibacteria bacterium]|jgi:uncharacterized coiled-coil DUF342 family protein|nr:hypothetical protein [Candidatus Saccharibacteria bacterium]
MMSVVAERIYAKTNDLIKDKEAVHNQINRLKQAIDSVKKHIHHTELEIVIEGASAHLVGLPDIRLANEMRELNKEKSNLRNDEKVLNELTVKYDEFTKMIDNHRFWMHRADTTDPARQREAEQKIFG